MDFNGHTNVSMVPANRRSLLWPYRFELGKAASAAGRMRNNALVGAYAYANPTVAPPVPSTVTPPGQSAQTLSYDGNGNQTAGLDGKGEGRPDGLPVASRQARTPSATRRAGQDL